MGTIKTAVISALAALHGGLGCGCMMRASVDAIKVVEAWISGKDRTRWLTESNCAA